MALPANSVIELTLQGSCLNQTILNVFHYAVKTPSSITLVTDEVAEFNDHMMTAGVGSFRNTFLACLPDNYTLDYSVAQAVYPIRYIRQRIGVTAAGVGDPVEAANTQVSITTQTVFAGRQFVGGKRLLASNNNALGGKWAGSYLALVQGFADEMLVEQTVTTGGGVYIPVIWHKPPGSGGVNQIIRAFVQPEVRVIRRRTVGLGI